MCRLSYLLFFAAAFGLLASGCSGPAQPELRRDLPAGFPNHSLSQIQEQVANGTDTLRAFRARARISLDTPERSGTFNAEIHYRRSDSLYMSLSPGLGIEAARALVTPDSFFVYDRVNNQLTYGALEDAEDRLPAPLVSGEAFENLLGLLIPEDDPGWTVSADSASYHLQDASGDRHYTVDPAFWRVTHYTEESEDGTLIEERSFSAFDRFGNLFLPQQVELRRPLDDTRASVRYRSLTLNPSSLSFDLRVRDSAERVLVS